MKCVIITVAGISSRFNEGVLEREKQLKAIYTEDTREHTLLFQLLKKTAFADKIVIVGGYEYESLKMYCESIPEFKNKILLVYNDHYMDLNSGFSLYLGIQEAIKIEADEIVFVEGDLDVDTFSFTQVAAADGNVLTYTREPIYASKAVVLYRNGEGKYMYAFNSSHGLLRIEESFSCILNSGQVWKFTDMKALIRANEEFVFHDKLGTNLGIIQRYIDIVPYNSFRLIELKQWTNCNTREDYKKIVQLWKTQ